MARTAGHTLGNVLRDVMWTQCVIPAAVDGPTVLDAVGTTGSGLWEYWAIGLVVSNDGPRFVHGVPSVTSNSGTSELSLPLPWPPSPHVQVASYTQEHPNQSEILVRCQTNGFCSAEQGVVESLHITKEIAAHMQVGAMSGGAAAVCGAAGGLERWRI